MADSSQSDPVSSSSSMSSSPMITNSCPMSGFIAPSPPPTSHSPSSLTSIERLEQENRVLKMEIETLKLRIKSLLEDNKSLRRASVSIQAKAEQEEEFISNTLLKRIQILKKEKETLALNYEQEEECLTNDLSRKLNQLRAEKVYIFLIISFNIFYYVFIHLFFHSIKLLFNLFEILILFGFEFSLFSYLSSKLSQLRTK